MTLSIKVIPGYDSVGEMRRKDIAVKEREKEKQCVCPSRFCVCFALAVAVVVLLFTLAN